MCVCSYMLLQNAISYENSSLLHFFSITAFSFVAAPHKCQHICIHTLTLIVVYKCAYKCRLINKNVCVANKCGDCPALALASWLLCKYKTNRRGAVRRGVISFSSNVLGTWLLLGQRSA